MSGEGEANRAILVANAVKFLQDPSIKGSSSLEKQIEFLQKKGLANVEIEEAMRVAGMTPPTQLLALLNNSTSDPTISMTSNSLSSSVAPPLPASPPTQLALSRTRQDNARFDWGRFLLVVALLGSAGVAISRSAIAKLVGRTFKRLREKIIKMINNDEDREVERHINNNSHVNNDNDELRRQISALGQVCASTLSSMKELRDDTKTDMDSLKTSLNCFYGELDRDIEELREEFQKSFLSTRQHPIEMQPIQTTDTDNNNMEKVPIIKE